MPSVSMALAALMAGAVAALLGPSAARRPLPRVGGRPAAVTRLMLPDGATRSAGPVRHPAETRVRRRFRDSRLRRVPPVVGLILALASNAAAAGLGTVTGWAALPVPVVAVVGVVLLRRRRSSAGRTAALRRGAVTEFCGSLAAELRAGRVPHDALSLAATGVESLAEPLRPVLAAARNGSDVPEVLRVAARGAGMQALRRVAACWAVAAEAGAGFAAALDSLAESLRAEEAVRREIAGQLASPRATARMLAVLPCFALLLGTGIGSAPLHVLLRTQLGLCCLSAGLALAITGVAWTDQMAQAVEDSL